MMLNYKILNDLSRKYGDSFYLLDSNVFTQNYREMLRAFTDIYPDTWIAYSYKTNYTPRLCRIINDQGGAAEIVSEMELWLARHIGVAGKDIYYNGPYKKAQFIEELMLLGGHVNLDAEYEIEIVEEIARKHTDCMLQVGIRCNVEIGQEIPSRFGFDVASGALQKAVERINLLPNVHVSGLHCHIPFRTLDSYIKRMEALKDILKIFPGYQWDYISLGGGYMGKVDEQIAKQLSYEPPTFDDYAKTVAGGMKDLFSGSEKRPTLIIEPGSALAASAVRYVTRVVNIKQARDKQIASLSGSTYQVNPSAKDIRRPITVYHSERGSAQKDYKHLDMAGYTCIESDYLYKDYCGALAVDDFVVFGNVGSYSVVMKPPFILPDIPILELMEDGSESVIKRAQTPEDIFMYYD